MTNTDFVLAIEDLTVSFDGFKAVDSLNLYLDKDELRVVIGPNGAGKTTVLDLICGKTKSTSGSIKFKNHELTTLAEHEIVNAGVGRKFQTPSIYENLSVYENLEISFPKGRGVFGSITFKNTPEVDARIKEVAADIFLGEFLDMESALLSHGQKQWLEIGMLLMQRPLLLLVDEPVAGMTHQEMEKTGELLVSLAGEHTVVVVEHDMEFIRSIARRVTVLNQGTVLAEGTMDDIQNNDDVRRVYLGE